MALVGIPKNEDALKPAILAMGTCRILRLKQIGAIFLVENRVAVHPETGEETWRVVSKATGEDARMEAMKWMCDANKSVIDTWRNDRKRRQA